MKAIQFALGFSDCVFRCATSDFVGERDVHVWMLHHLFFFFFCDAVWYLSVCLLLVVMGISLSFELILTLELYNIDLM